MKQSIYTLLILAFISIFTSCAKEEVEDTRLAYSEDSINPTDEPSRLSRSISMNGVNVSSTFNFDLERKFENFVINPDLNVINGLESASVTNDNYLFLTFIVDPAVDISGAYIYISGADNYWKIELDSINELLQVNIKIPKHIQAGDFIIEYRIFDSVGNVSLPRPCFVNIVDQKSGCYDSVSGADGVTVRSYTFDDFIGQIRVSYDTYSIPDRVDIRYGNEWIYSTSPTLPNNTHAPIIKRCSDVVLGDGFLGANDVIYIDYDKSIGERVDVYLSGCLDSSTAWDFTISCVQ
ncbi:MAG: hypothetical protein ACI86M_002411 [Saprospiraceae bacterium]|jgi:hypothetical protein